MILQGPPTRMLQARERRGEETEVRWTGGLVWEREAVNQVRTPAPGCRFACPPRTCRCQRKSGLTLLLVAGLQGGGRT